VLRRETASVAGHRPDARIRTHPPPLFLVRLDCVDESGIGASSTPRSGQPHRHARAPQSFVGEPASRPFASRALTAAARAQAVTQSIERASAPRSASNARSTTATPNGLAFGDERRQVAVVSATTTRRRSSSSAAAQPSRQGRLAVTRRTPHQAVCICHMGRGPRRPPHRSTSASARFNRRHRRDARSTIMLAPSAGALRCNASNVQVGPRGREARPAQQAAP